ncbi:DNA mismatch repair protein MutS [Sabulilitoribacter arenilitoris]|uniref:DNA mismatch repair protein MutS n=1 Tax=Wocania arenilitoris TaxID=2044858 RepID=A0AAE3EPK5_9FLAO|nr:DNA mismatch repair protein MutS [Wocania arenilitoris]MCF7569308.1 DNA mismatch repair protein MutS [Wocania arenilitoris]
MMNNNFKINDYVLVIDENLSGTIKKIDNSLISIETEDGFLLDFKAKELIKINADKAIQSDLFTSDSIKSAIYEKEQYIKKPVKKAKPKARYEPTLEIDLHINQLVKSSKNMSNHDMLTLQLDTARRQLEFAIKKRIQKIVFIHGVGEGVLKMELDYLFGRYNNMKFYDANYQKYGLGATEVYIYQNVAT